MHWSSTILPLLAAIGVATAGCSSNSSTVPGPSNPFTTADRVPPPIMRSPSYYPNPTGASATPTAGAVAPTYPQGSPGLSPAPGAATPYYGASVQRGATSPGDSISVPTDGGSLRFASPSETALARQQNEPVQREQQTLIASSAPPQRRAASANAWIAGSAPVPNTSTVAGTRVRLPGSGAGREPVSLAAIDGRAPIAPLEPVPTGQRPGEPATLRVATPSSGTGWR